MANLQVAMNRTGYLLILSNLFLPSAFSSSQDITSAFHCRKLGHPGGVFVVGLSGLLTLLASGQKSNDPMVPIEIEKRHGSALVYRIAFAQTTDVSQWWIRRIGGDIFIHDVPM